MTLIFFLNTKVKVNEKKKKKSRSEVGKRIEGRKRHNVRKKEKK
jgi:hypothetical protein